jgi:hypothetical protein
MKPPPRWQDCEPFVAALLKRQYVVRDSAGELLLPMSPGLYLYMYELWQDGHDAASA